MNKRAIIIILAVLILVSGYVAYHYIQADGELSYEVITVRKGNLVQKVLATGTVNAIMVVPVGSQVSGTIKEIYVDYNNFVQKGQLLGLIDPDAFKAQLAKEQANLTSKKANLLYIKALLEKSEVQLKDKETNLKRLNPLFETGIISRSKLDEAEASYETAVADKNAQVSLFNAEQHALEAAQESVNLARINLEWAKILSPIDGIVISRSVEVGQTVTIGQSSLFEIAQDIRHMEVKADVSEADIGKIKLEQEVTFTVDTYPDKVFNGKVEEIRIGPNIKHNVVTYGVISSIDNRELLLKPGMTVDVWIKTNDREGALLVPTIAIKEKGGNRYVEILEWKRIKERMVKTGLKSTDGFIEVLSGLKEGENLILSRKIK